MRKRTVFLLILQFSAQRVKSVNEMFNERLLPNTIFRSVENDIHLMCGTDGNCFTKSTRHSIAAQIKQLCCRQKRNLIEARPERVCGEVTKALCKLLLIIILAGNFIDRYFLCADSRLM